MDNHLASVNAEAAAAPTGIIGKWHNIPLYWRILGAMILGIGVGLMLGEKAEGLAIPSKLVLQILGALAPPLILTAVIHALMTADLKGKTAGRLVVLLLLNTVVAICIGLLVANVVQPGTHSNVKLEQPDAAKKKVADPNAAPLTVDQKIAALDEKIDELTAKPAVDPAAAMLDNVPKSLLGPLADGGKVIGVIFLAISFGMAFRKHRDAKIGSLEDLVSLLMNSLITILHWVIDIVPFAVFGIVASIIGTKGFAAFHAIGMFVLAVILALVLQAAYYLIRIRMGSWINPLTMVRELTDAYTMAFSTGSSTITMPLTYASLKDRVGLRERSASMGALVGANFNNDGTALYEAMSALFIAQLMGMHLSIPQQLMVVVTSVVASVGAAGIPEAGLVTMTLVFHAVGLPPEHIALLLTVDWFLDRCRTVINVMGDCNVSCLLDGKIRETAEEKAQLLQEKASRELLAA